jgi:hypothetical protein
VIGDGEAYPKDFTSRGGVKVLVFHRKRP